MRDTLTALDDTAPAGLHPTTKGRAAEYYRQPYPGHEHPWSSSDTWEYATSF